MIIRFVRSLRCVRHRALLAAAALVLAACTEAPPEDMPIDESAPDTALLGAQAVEIGGFTLDTARRAAWSSVVMAPARVVLDPAKEQVLGSITEGRITRVLVRVGDPVRAGDILVAIHSHEIMDARSGLASAESQLSTAVAERDAAELNLKRAERLLAARAMGQADVERATVAATVARARVREAAAELLRARGLMEHLLGDGPLPSNLDPHEVLIRAPMSGVVVARSAAQGTVVLPGDPLVSVADPTALQLELRLTDRQVAGVRAGTTFKFVLVGEDASAAPGRAVVTRVSPVVDQATRTVLILANITNAPPGTRAERFATAQLADGAAGKESGDVLIVPMQSVQALTGDTVVIVAQPRGEGLFLEAKAVRVGRRNATHAEILAGLTEGELVIARGATIARAELLKRRDGGGGADH